MSLAGMKLLEEIVSQARLEVEFMEGLTSSQSSSYSPADEDSTPDDRAQAVEQVTNSTDSSDNSNDDSINELKVNIGNAERTSEGATKVALADTQEDPDEGNAHAPN